MEFNQFHFADPIWFLGLIIIPITCFLYLFFYRSTTNTSKLEKFADKHMLPHIFDYFSINSLDVFNVCNGWTTLGFQPVTKFFSR